MALTIRPGITLKPGVTLVKPLPPASYSLTSVANNVDEGSSLTFNVTTTAVPDGTITARSQSSPRISLSLVAHIVVNLSAESNTDDKT
jgi:hypothetical protein